jgi:hypothetical protein
VVFRVGLPLSFAGRRAQKAARVKRRFHTRWRRGELTDTRGLRNERQVVLGIEDKFVALAYVLCVAASVLCIVYGLMRWNKEDEPTEEADQRWVEHELEESEEV